MKEVETKLYTSATAALEEQVKAELNIPDPPTMEAALAAFSEGHKLYLANKKEE